MQSTRILIFSDTHYPFVDRRAMNILLMIARDSGRGFIQPFDGYYANGDLCHLPRMSRHARDSDWDEEDYETTRAMLRRDFALLAQADPTAERIARKGNHDDNWQEWIDRNAPDANKLQDDRGMLLTFERWIGFEDIGWKYWGSEEPITFPRGSARPNFLLVHGDIQGCGGVGAAKKLLSRWGKSGASGHIHRPQMHTASHWPNQPVGWWVAGCMCVRKFRYLKDDAMHPDWVQGFLTVTFDESGRFWVEQHFFIEHGRELRTVLDGYFYSCEWGKEANRVPVRIKRAPRDVANRKRKAENAAGKREANKRIKQRQVNRQRGNR